MNAPLRTLLVALLLTLLIALVQAAEITKAQIDHVAKELACLCGTCPRRPLDECTCGYAQQQRDRIKKALASGQDKQMVVAGFVQEFGQEVYSAPPKKGFNLTAWVMPFFALLLGGFVVRSVVRSWSQNRPAATAPRQSDATDPYKTRLEQELKERDP